MSNTKTRNRSTVESLNAGLLDMTGWERAAGWVRVSTTEQDSEKQWPEIQKHCQTNHYQIVETYSIEASAFKGRQDKLLQQMITDIRNKKITVVVAFASDRMERRGMEATLKLCREVREAGGRIEFTAGLLRNSNDVSGELIGGLAGWVAEQESILKRDRQRITNEEKRANGVPPNRLAYGYKRVEGKTIIDDGQAEIVREIFRRYAAGEGPPTLAKSFNDRGIPSPSGARWRSDGIRKMLRNVVYVAKRMHNGEVVVLADGKEPQWLPIIDLDLWYNVQARIETQKDEYGKQYRSSDGPYLLASTILCGECGNRMECLASYVYEHVKVNGVKQRKDPNAKGVRNGQHYACHVLGCCKVSVEKEEMDQFVKEKMIEWMANPEIYTQLNTEDNSADVAKYRAEVRRLDAELIKNQKEYDDGVITAKMAGGKERKLTAEREAAEQKAKDAALPSVLKGAVGVNAARDWNARSVHENREIIRKVARIRVRSIGRGHNNQYRRVPVGDRTDWEWLIGPEANKNVARVERYLTPRERFRTALMEDPIIFQLNHTEIARKLGTSPDTIKGACESLVADGTISECTHRLTPDGLQRGQKLAVKGGAIRTALTSDTELSNLTHIAIASRLGMSPTNVMRACKALISDGTFTECGHTLNEDGTVNNRVLGRKRVRQALKDNPPVTGSARVNGAVAAACALLRDYPDLAALSHEALGNRLGLSRYNVQRACQKLRELGEISECTHDRPKPWSKTAGA